MDYRLLATIVAAVIVILAITCCLWVANRRREHCFFKKHGIPGPEPDLFSGNWLQLKENRLQVMDGWIKRYGKIFGFYAGEKPFMVITDTELIKQCFVREVNTAYYRPPPLVREEKLQSSLIRLQGEEWKKIRAKLNPIFTPAKIRMLTPIVQNCVDQMMEVLDETVTKGEAVDIDNVSRGYSMDVITKSALAWQVDCQTNTNHPFVVQVRKVFESADSAEVINAIQFPILRSVFAWLAPFTDYFNVANRIEADIRNILELRRRGERPRTTDMLQLMLEAQEGIHDSTVGHRGEARVMEDHHVASNCVIFLVAGFHTTAFTVALVIYMLAKHPEEQERVLRELAEMLPDEDALTYDAVQKLKRLDMVICETLRMYPPVVLFVNRHSKADTMAMGHFIPAGVNIVVPTWNIHHDPEHWPDPFKFDPERFTDGAKAHSAYFPFGIGPRSCIGKTFALLEVKMAVSSLLRKYKICQCDKTEDPVKLLAMPIVMKAENGIYVRLQRR